MHWAWKNCPFAWQRLNKGYIGECGVIFEVVEDCDMWIWHAFVGMVGSRNNINVLQCSLIFARLADDHVPKVNYEINSHTYTKGYYPKLSTFVKTIPNPILRRILGVPNARSL
jgi:hypothetical protein